MKRRRFAVLRYTYRDGLDLFWLGFATGSWVMAGVAIAAWEVVVR